MIERKKCEEPGCVNGLMPVTDFSYRPSKKIDATVEYASICKACQRKIYEKYQATGLVEAIRIGEAKSIDVADNSPLKMIIGRVREVFYDLPFYKHCSRGAHEKVLLFNYEILKKLVGN